MAKVNPTHRGQKRSPHSAKLSAGSVLSGPKSSLSGRGVQPVQYAQPAREAKAVVETHGKDTPIGTVLTDEERRAKVLEILNSLDAYAPPRVGDLDLSEPGRVRIKKGRERPLKFS